MPNFVKDVKWKKGITVLELTEQMGAVGFQATEIKRAAEAVVKMKQNGAKIYLTFTSNMATSGMRGFFAQIIEMGIVDVIVTGVGAIEEDIMRANGEKFIIGGFGADDVELHEKGVNRVGNLLITNESYCRLEDMFRPMLKKMYQKKAKWLVSEMMEEIGTQIEDEGSILHQAAKRKVPIFVPGITDGALGFHLFMFQQEKPDFTVEVVKDFAKLNYYTTQDDKKGVIALGGGIAKHQALLACILNGGMDYAVYMTTEHEFAGSLSGATTKEAKSWGKIKDDSDAVTVIGDVSITFPIMMMTALEIIEKEKKK